MNAKHSNPTFTLFSKIRYEHLDGKPIVEDIIKVAFGERAVWVMKLSYPSTFLVNQKPQKSNLHHADIIFTQIHEQIQHPNHSQIGLPGYVSFSCIQSSVYVLNLFFQ